MVDFEPNVKDGQSFNKRQTGELLGTYGKNIDRLISIGLLPCGVKKRYESKGLYWYGRDIKRCVRLYNKT